MHPDANGLLVPDTALATDTVAAGAVQPYPLTYVIYALAPAQPLVDAAHCASILQALRSWLHYPFGAGQQNSPLVCSFSKPPYAGRPGEKRRRRRCCGPDREMRDQDPDGGGGAGGGSGGGGGVHHHHGGGGGGVTTTTQPTIAGDERLRSCRRRRWGWSPDRRVAGKHRHREGITPGNRRGGQHPRVRRP